MIETPPKRASGKHALLPLFLLAAGAALSASLTACSEVTDQPYDGPNIDVAKGTNIFDNREIAGGVLGACGKLAVDVNDIAPVGIANGETPVGTHSGSYIVDIADIALAPGSTCKASQVYIIKNDATPVG
jgi:hypothetical protein